MSYSLKMKWFGTFVLGIVYWFVGLFILGYLLALFGIIDSGIIGSNNIILYIVSWIVAQWLAFKTTKTSFF